MTETTGADILDLGDDLPDAPEGVVADPAIEAPPTEEPAFDTESDLRIQTKKFVLQALFEKSSSVVPSKDIMPVLKNFQIEAKPGQIRVLATDLELSVVSYTEMVQVARPGTAVLPAKKILEILRDAEDEEMVIDIREGVAYIEAGRTKWTLKLQNGDDYPPLPDIADIELHAIDRGKLLSSIGSVRHAAATETTRPSLMMIDVADGKMTACDGVRFQQTLLEENFPLDFQIPVGAVDDLVKLLRMTDLDSIGIGESDFHLVFKVGQDVFIASKLMAQFPDVEQLLLKPALRNDAVLQLDTDDLKAAVKRVKINSDPETSAIILELSENLVTVKSQDKFGNASSEDVPADWSQAEREIVVNHKFLMDMLSMYDGKSAKFKLGVDTKSRKSPILLEDDTTQTKGIIQQMRSDWTVD